MMQKCCASLSLVLLAGCGFEGAQSIPFPGGVSGPDTYTVKVHVPDATNLVRRESCRSNDTVVGTVEAIALDNELKAVVTCRVRNDVTLPANATASIRQTSLLGERYVSIESPAGAPRVGRLAPGAEIREASTELEPDVEMVLGALSLVLNGGGLSQVETITRELNAALSKSNFGGTLRELRDFMGTLDRQKSDITATLVALDELSGRLSRQRGVIADSLEAIPEGIETLDDNRPRLIEVLRELDDLAEVAVPLIRQTRKNSKADLEHLAAVLAALSKSGKDLALAFERLGLFPFPSQTDGAVRFDYAGAYFAYILDVDFLNEILGSAAPTDVLAPAGQPAGTSSSADKDGGVVGPVKLPPLPGVSGPITDILPNQADGLLDPQAPLDSLDGLLGGAP
jgi:phospholipid/cholesterol/gamma-HCH transport system substrate-binding protein